jgi:hypothetical protein
MFDSLHRLAYPAAFCARSVKWKYGVFFFRPSASLPPPRSNRSAQRYASIPAIGLDSDALRLAPQARYAAEIAVVRHRHRRLPERLHHVGEVLDAREPVEQ